ncbi:unnamed protein product [Caenorhabditis angaria]|uniref:choline-phosphate cytidylyltransferase n=1 Tax=Caenorhabditis angaria TaxID=860376 RepID=A0A9P1II68_9PELO|nr:unnamed protein product [Caenorhabditis angaria]
MFDPLATSEPAPFSDDPKIVEKRELIDFEYLVTVEEAMAGKDIGRPYRVLASGVFDLFHYGHANQLRQIKQLIPNCYLIAAVTSDEDTIKYKGPPVQTLAERSDSVRHCRYVDEVCRICPFDDNLQFMDSMKIDFAAHDTEPYVLGNVTDIFAEHKACGRFLATQRTEGTSTSDSIYRILKDYDSFVKRNMNRGYSPEQMNVGFFMTNRMKAQEKFGSIKNRGKVAFEDFKSKSDEYFQNVNESFRDNPHRIRAQDKLATFKTRGIDMFSNLKFRVETMWNQQVINNEQ